MGKNGVIYHVRILREAISQDVTMPLEHKTILQAVLGFISHIGLSVMDVVLGVDNSALILPSAWDGVPYVLGPVMGSLAKLLAIVGEQPGVDEYVLHRLFYFVGKVLPAAVDLFSSGLYCVEDTTGKAQTELKREEKHLV